MARHPAAPTEGKELQIAPYSTKRLTFFEIAA
jgi:hypothetical protein